MLWQLIVAIKSTYNGKPEAIAHYGSPDWTDIKAFQYFSLSIVMAADQNE